MKVYYILLLINISAIAASYSQPNEKISTIDFVQILNKNKEEALHYYQNNWQKLRKKALEKGYITSYTFIETPFSKEAPFDIILITTYPNKVLFEKSETHFDILIEENGGLDLLNDKTPDEFRQIVMGKTNARHWN